jgi:hypothetical protein
VLSAYFRDVRVYCLTEPESAEDWDEVLLPEIERQQGAVFRADAAIAKPEIYETLDDRE